MSHIVTIKTEVRDPAAVAAACRRLGLPEPERGTARLFEGEAAGLLVKLPGWLYPAVFHVDTGQVQFDNYGGAWGRREHLDRFLQRYALEKAHIEARRRGHGVVEQPPGRRVRQAHHHRRRCLVSQVIEITVDPKGETTVQTRGFAGSACREASRFVEQALGQRTAEQLTAEFHQGQQAAQELRQSR